METKNNELVTIQSHLKAPKSQFNEHNKFRYRSCEDILEALKPHLLATNCTLIITDDIVMVGQRIYVKATATLTNRDGRTWQTTAFARETEARKGMDESQITGAASSYARKYALNGLFAIDDTKDADTLNDGEQEPAKAKSNAQEPPKYKYTRLDDALNISIKSAVSMEQLMQMWMQSAPELQTNEQYRTRFTARKKELLNK